MRSTKNEKPDGRFEKPVSISYGLPPVDTTSYIPMPKVKPPKCVIRLDDEVKMDDQLPQWSMKNELHSSLARLKPKPSKKPHKRKYRVP
ncbi:MAG: hypothetical protein HQK60_08710 [Deltaproteobacteria bacterium]|nr:hypothetical protein [Deltaproteobacteria bacterium]